MTPAGRSRLKRRSSRGMTLLEILVSLGIMSMISLLIYGAICAGLFITVILAIVAIPLGIVLAVLGVVFPIIAGIKASTAFVKIFRPITALLLSHVGKILMELIVPGAELVKLV